MRVDGIFSHFPSVEYSHPEKLMSNMNQLPMSFPSEENIVGWQHILAIYRVNL